MFKQLILLALAAVFLLINISSAEPAAEPNANAEPLAEASAEPRIKIGLFDQLSKLG
uniref:Alpha-pompilidotoxin n=1 Tax=Anoplius samariensis TaxID=200614 RepID=PMTXA_ANOSM|nr:RecName: Full=Alpha-pompilidotoxin; Short=Alpha-PMTX; Flags: Precursor [Anoplius samariensis]BAF65254.1 alpha-pompilidotoxin [Anoplius samariensis]